MKNGTPKPSTSWEPVGRWYNKAVGSEGLYYHKNIIIPAVLRLMNLDNCNSPSVLDLACGQGILSKNLSSKVPYHGVDISATLIAQAKKANKHPNHQFSVCDATKPLSISKRDFSHATIILAIQNIASMNDVFQNASKHLRPGGSLIIVMNHPCFRIPRQSSWGVDSSKNVQYRRLDHYMSPLSIPIQAHPSKKEQSASTLSFHAPLSKYIEELAKAGFVIAHLEEWCSDKKSTGRMAKIEDKARQEFPLFLCLQALKI